MTKEVKEQSLREWIARKQPKSCFNAKVCFTKEKPKICYDATPCPYQLEQADIYIAEVTRRLEKSALTDSKKQGLYLDYDVHHDPAKLIEATVKAQLKASLEAVNGK